MPTTATSCPHDTKVVQISIKQPDQILIKSDKNLFPVSIKDNINNQYSSSLLINTSICQYDTSSIAVSTDSIVEVESTSTNDNDLAVTTIENNEENQEIGLYTEILYKNGRSPYINTTTGTWFEYDDDAGTFINTNIQASGNVNWDSIIYAWDNRITEV